LAINNLSLVVSPIKKVNTRTLITEAILITNELQLKQIFT